MEMEGVGEGVFELVMVLVVEGEGGGVREREGDFEDEAVSDCDFEAVLEGVWVEVLVLVGRLLVETEEV